MESSTRNNFGRTTVPPFIARLKNPSVPGESWTERKVYYDTYSVAANTLCQGVLATMFQVPLGNGGKTLASTNMKDTGKIADSAVFYIGAFGVIISHNSPADAYNLGSNLTVKLRVGIREYTSGPLQMFPGGRGMVAGGSLPAAIGTLTSVASVNNGVAHIENVFKFIGGIKVDPGQSISVELTAEGNGFTTATSGNGGTGFSVQPWIDGIETSKAQ